MADGAAAVADLSDARAQIARLESEMRVVLRAMEQQKSAAQRNMAQLGRIWEDWQRGGGRRRRRPGSITMRRVNLF